MLKEGMKAPAFTLKNDEDREVSLSDLKGKKNRSVFLSER